MATEDFQYMVIKFLCHLQEAIDSGGASAMFGSKHTMQPIMQLDTIEDVDRFETELVDATVYERTVASLVGAVGGSNIQQLVVGMVSRLMTNSCQSNYSMVGRKGKKVLSS